MLIRSGRIQFLFWTAFFAAMLYLWIMAVGLQTFVLPDQKPMELPQNVATLMFMLYAFLTIDLMVGIVVSTMIDNGFYQRYFAFFIILSFVSVIAAKSLFG